MNRSRRRCGDVASVSLRFCGVAMWYVLFAIGVVGLFLGAVFPALVEVLMPIWGVCIVVLLLLFFSAPKVPDVPESRGGGDVSA